MNKKLKNLYMILAKRNRQISMAFAKRAIVAAVAANKDRKDEIIPLAFEGAPAESMWLENGHLRFKNQRHRFCWNDLTNIYRYVNNMP